MKKKHSVGEYIKHLRKRKGMTQRELADKLYITYQAVSKWEQDESLPDSSILLKLSNLLDTSVDLLLNGGVVMREHQGFMSVEDVFKGFEALENVKKYFGEKSTFYIGMVEGINAKMNIDLEEYLLDDHARTVMITEVLIQHLMSGGVIDMEEVKAFIKNEKMIKYLEEYQEKYARNQ